VSVIEAILFFGLMATGVVIQYARRRRWFALVVMLAGIAAFPLITAFVPWESMMASAYPPAVRGQVPYTVALVPKNAPDKGTELDFDKKHVQLSVPVEVSGVPTDTLVDIEAARFYIDLPNGGQWDSKWQGGAQPITDEKKVVALSLLMDRDVYEQVKSSPVSVHMTIAVQELKDADPKRVVVQPTFQMPQVGLCWVQQEYGIECRSTRLGPKHLLMTMVQAENTCEQDGADANARPVRRMLSGVAPINPLSPLALAPFYFAMWNYEQRQNAGQVCPGTPVTVSTPHFSRRFRYDMELGRLTLPNYEFRYGAGSGSIGISVAVPVR
jgi:hypothetical protein